MSISSLVERFRRDNQVPGMAVAVFSTAGCHYAEGFGTLHAGPGAGRVTPESVFRTFSLAKSFTATALCTLADDAVLGLDVPVDEYVPEISVRGGTGAGQITLRHLLSNSAGFVPDAIQHERAGRDPDALSKEIVATARRLPLLARPDEVFAYSNAGFALAGFVAERITGEPFADLVRKTVFEPLDMPVSTHDPAVAMTYPLLQQHRLDAAGRPEVVHEPRVGVRHAPSGLCFSTVREMAAYGAFQLAVARGRIVGDHLAAAQRPHVEVPTAVEQHYGLGLFVGPRRGGEFCLGHEGFFEGSWTKLLLFPGADLGLVWTDNRGPELRGRRYAVLEDLLGELGAPEPDPATRGGARIERDAAAGTYRRWGAAALTIAESADADAVELDDGAVRVRAHRVGPRAFAAEDIAAGPPWAPHVDNAVISVAFGSAEDDGAPDVVHLNGLPYRRG